MKANQKKQLLTVEVKKFKDFKQRVLLRDSSGRPPVIEVPTAASAGTPRVVKPEIGALLSAESKEAIDYFVEQIRKELKAEFHTLRQIIKNMGA
jgi:hypothetical protein